MTLFDFTKQPRGPYAFDFWISNQTIPSPLGEFQVELQLLDGDDAPPDRGMLRRAEELIALFRANLEIIHDKVYEHYQATTAGMGWLGMCGIRAGLSRTDILAHLEVRTLTVARNDDADEPYVCRVYIIPDWDEEHAIYLAYDDGEWEFVES